MKKIVVLIVLATLVLQTGFLSDLSVRAQGDVTPTPTLEPTATATGTPEPTATASPTASPTPSETETPLPTETATATATETASATPSATETPIPYQTPAPTATSSLTPTAPPVQEDITLSISAKPNVLRRGATLQVEWQIKGLRNVEKGMILRFYLPIDVTVVDPRVGIWNEKENTFEIESPALKGSVEFKVGEKTESPLVITAEFLQNGMGKAKAEISLLEADETLVESKGGSADGLKGQVVVNFPAGAVRETVKVTIQRPSKESLPVESLSGAPFEIIAVSEQSKVEVSHFAEPVEIQVKYSEAIAGSEEDIVLYWYDPTDGQWKLPLSQRVDTENNLIIATTDHFTVYDAYNANWQTAVTPTLNGFNLSEFTGASNYSMPIKVPPGPGGLQPSLALTYSSSTVDYVTTESQASWVGMGWSMTDSYIERNGHGTNGILDDSFQLNLNGMSVELFRSGDPYPDGTWEYHSRDENFYKVIYNFPPNLDEQQSTWTIWDKTGNQYFFEERTNMVRSIPCSPGDENPNGIEYISDKVWRWSLTKVRNIHGQEMTYSYARDSKAIQYIDCHKNSSSVTAPTWVYPSQILYPNGRYRVRFIRNNDRADFKNLWTSAYAYYSYQQSLLDRILVEHYNGSAWTIIRKYQFDYCDGPNDCIFPDYVWEAGGRTPTLLSVTEYGLGGSQPLPAYTFDYDDDMHLTSASNGYGGTITFNYDNWHEEMPYQDWGNNLGDFSAPSWGNPIKYHFRNSEENWTGIGTPPNQTGIVTYISGGGGAIDVWGTVQNTTMKSFMPGRWYMAVASVKRSDAVGTHDIKLGFNYKENGVYHPVYGAVTTLSGTYQTISSDAIFIPAGATSLIPRMVSTGTNRVAWIYIFPLPTAYRVTSRTLSAGGGNSYTFTYAYEGAATNSPQNTQYPNGISVAAGGAHPYVKPYTEFRGHETMTETDPYNNQVITVFNQDDCKGGLPISATVKSPTKILHKTTTGYACTQWNTNLTLYDEDTRDPNLYGTPFDPLKYRWVRTSSDRKYVYQNSPNISIANTLTEYEYDSTYGNLTSQTISGTGIDTLTTVVDYTINVSGGRWLVGLVSRVSVWEDATLLSRMMSLYDYHDAYNDPPTEGRLTGARTWINGNSFNQSELQYDIYGNVISQTAYSGYWNNQTPGTPTGARTKNIVYDSTYHTYPTSITNAMGHQTLIAYDYVLGAPTGIRDPNNVWTYASYDAFGRFTSLTRPGDSSPSLTVSYQDSPFQVTLNQVIDESNTLTVTRSYDGMGRPTMTNVNGVMVDASYDAYDRVLTQSMPHNSAEIVYNTTVTYDTLGRPLTVTAPGNLTTSYAYDGLESTVTDAKGNQTTMVANILGRTLSVTPKDGNGTAIGPNVVYTYDLLGHLKTATRGNATVSINYDKAGRKIAMDDPDMGKKGDPDDAQWGWTYQYDALGNLTQQIDARGCTLAMTYDLLNRLDTKNSSGTECVQQVNVDYDYDDIANGNKGKGRLTSMEDNSGSTEWFYDTRGRVTKKTNTIDTTEFITRWTYNTADLPVTMTYPGGEVVTTTYDSNILPISVIGNAIYGNYATNMDYDSAGRMTVRSLGNGLTQNFGYYDWNEKVNNIGQGGRLETLVTGSLQNLSYVYDKDGNVEKIKEYRDNALYETNTYGYDALNRLTSWQLNQDFPETYTYDTEGNLDLKNTLNLEYENADHTHAVTSAGGNTYTYDDNGNQITRHIGNDNFNLSYNAENRLAKVKKNNVTMAEFTYDGNGQRVKAIYNGETTYFVGGYFEQKGSEITKYYFAGGSRIAMRKYTVPVSMKVEYMLGDHLGSTSITTDTTGEKISEMRYTPWGEVRSHWIKPNLSTTPAYRLPIYSFTGQRSYMDDPSTTEIEGFGLMDYNARMYDPVTGRFTSADSIVAGGVQGYDRYNYVNNSPMVYTDPTGHAVHCMSMNGCGGWAGEGGGSGGSGGATGPSDCATTDSYTENREAAMKEIKDVHVSIAGDWMPNIREYAIAGIGVQNPYKDDRESSWLWNNVRPLFSGWLLSPMEYTGEGPALISDAQMEWPYGQVITYNNGKDTNGVGLGLRTPFAPNLDQTQPDIALLAMMTRIQILYEAFLDRCDGLACNNATNRFVLAAIASDAMLPEDLRDLVNGIPTEGVLPFDKLTGDFDWEHWLTPHRRDVLQDFVNSWAWIEEHGGELPEGVDWDLICDLLD